MRGHHHKYFSVDIAFYEYYDTMYDHDVNAHDIKLF